MKPIATYTISNNSGILIFEVDYHQDKVLAGANFDEAEWCDITLDYEGFIYGEMEIRFDECIRVE